MKTLHAIERYLARFSKTLAYAGAVLILVDAFWISISVFRRYVLNDPDPVVTEAAALLLLPLAFAGLAYSFAEDANPKVTMLIDKLPATAAMSIEALNLLVGAAVGVMLTAFSSTATIRSYASGAASPVIEWPEYFLWASVAIFSLTFTLLVMVRLSIRLANPSAVQREG